MLDILAKIPNSPKDRYGSAVIQWTTSCHKNRLTKRVMNIMVISYEIYATRRRLI